MLHAALGLEALSQVATNSAPEHGAASSSQSFGGRSRVLAAAFRPELRAALPSLSLAEASPLQLQD